MSVRVFLDNIGRDYFLADIVQSVFGRHQSKLFFADVYRDYFLVDVKQDYFFVDIGWKTSLTDIGKKTLADVNQNIPPIWSW